MEYVRTVDFATIEATASRFTQSLLDRDSGATTCSINCIKTPIGDGSPAGLHTHPFDQVFYILEGTMSLEIGGEQHEAGPGSLIVFPAGIPHRKTRSLCALHRSMRFRGGSGGFRLCEVVHVRLGADAVLTFCDA